GAVGRGTPARGVAAVRRDPHDAAGGRRGEPAAPGDRLPAPLAPPTSVQSGLTASPNGRNSWNPRSTGGSGNRKAPIRGRPVDPSTVPPANASATGRHPRLCSKYAAAVPTEGHHTSSRITRPPGRTTSRR